MYARPASPQSIGQVLDGSFRLTAAAFRHTWLLALLAGLASYAASAYQFTRGDTVVQALTAPQDPVYWSLYVGGVLLSMLFFAVILLRIDSLAGGTAAGTGALPTALRRLPLLIVLLVLTMVALIVGLVLLLIPGLILMISLMLATPILLLEDKGPFASLTASHRLVWGHWWRTAAIITVAGIIMIVLYFIFGLIGAAIAPLLAGGDPLVASLVSLLIVLALLGVLFTPFFVSLILNVYWDLKLRKEGADLAARASAV